jgi:hypothetical protein
MLMPDVVSADVTATELLELLANLPVSLNVDDLTSLAALDAADIAALVRREILAASPDTLERIARALRERPGDSWFAWGAAIEVSVSETEISIGCERQHVVTRALVTRPRLN